MAEEKTQDTTSDLKDSDSESVVTLDGEVMTRKERKRRQDEEDELEKEFLRPRRKQDATVIQQRLRAAYPLAYTIPKSLYMTAQAHQDQLTDTDRTLLLSRKDVYGRALGAPQSLTEAEKHQLLSWPDPDTVAKLIRQATSNQLSTPAELFAKAKNMDDLAKMSDAELDLILGNFGRTGWSRLEPGEDHDNRIPGNVEAATLVTRQMDLFNVMIQVNRERMARQAAPFSSTGMGQSLQQPQPFQPLQPLQSFQPPFQQSVPLQQLPTRGNPSDPTLEAIADELQRLRKDYIAGLMATDTFNKKSEKQLAALRRHSRRQTTGPGMIRSSSTASEPFGTGTMGADGGPPMGTMGAGNARPFPPILPSTGSRPTPMIEAGGGNVPGMTPEMMGTGTGSSLFRMRPGSLYGTGPPALYAARPSQPEPFIPPGMRDLPRIKGVSMAEVQEMVKQWYREEQRLKQVRPQPADLKFYNTPPGWALLSTDTEPRYLFHRDVLARLSDEEREDIHDLGAYWDQEWAALTDEERAAYEIKCEKSRRDRWKKIMQDDWDFFLNP